MAGQHGTPNSTAPTSDFDPWIWYVMTMIDCLSPPQGRSGLRRLPLAHAPPQLEAAHVPPTSARISLTDRCDLACVYCRPSRSDGYLERRLDEEAWQTMVRALVQAGIKRIRITGGEPLLHQRVVERVAFVASLGVEDLALTTNATRLADLAIPLQRAGLRRLTVSLDSLVSERFRQITRGGRLDRVLAGIEAALGSGYAEIKTNTVVLRGDNDHELTDIVLWAWDRGILPRFIEVMRIGEGAHLPADKLVGAREMRDRLATLLVDEPGTPDENRGPARYVRGLVDRRRRVGFITGTTDTYCGGCDRLRVASDGVLRPCLATNDGVAAMPQADARDVDGVIRALGQAWSLKPDGRTWKGCTEPTAAGVSIRAIGG
jgi:cyclic pyranopterin phosphate synthase